jgi:hypothetical protein
MQRIRSAYIFSQVTILALCAIASGALWALWRRLLDADRNRVWKHYGWFTALTCLGCCTAVLAYASWSQFIINSPAVSASQNFGSIPGDIQAASESGQVSGFGAVRFCCCAPASRSTIRVTLQQAARWLIGFYVTYPFTSCCVSISKLLVLNRMMTFSKRWSTGSFPRIVLAFVVVGSALGLCVNIAASYFLSKAYTAFDAAAATNSSSSFGQARRDRSSGVLAGAFHLFFEALMLLFIVIGVAIGGIASARRFRDYLSVSDQQISQFKEKGELRQADLASASQQQNSVRSLRVRILATCVVVFFSFLLRAIYAILFALVGSLNDSSRECPTYTNRCSDCFNNFTLIQVWLIYSPEFFFAVVLISEPVALLVALWGMTSGYTLQSLMNQINVERSDKGVLASLPLKISVQSS